MKRIYVVADLVGSSGVRVAEQHTPGTAAWRESRAWLTADVNAVIGAAFGAGAEEVLVCDVHASGNNLLLDELDSRAIVEEPFGPTMLPGISDEFTGLVIVGGHAMAGARGAFFDHTWNAAEWFRYRLAGDDCGEIGLWAAYAGHFSVPLLLVTGDAAACREAESFVPGVETFAVKEAISRDHARIIHPAAAAKYLGEAAARAVARADGVDPSLVDLPTEAEVEYVRTEFADIAALREGAERIGPRTVRRQIGSTLDLLKGF